MQQYPSSDETVAMREAVDRAIQAMSQSGKAGIAASIILNGKSVAVGENEVRLQSDPTKHAEMCPVACCQSVANYRPVRMRDDLDVTAL